MNVGTEVPPRLLFKGHLYYTKDQSSARKRRKVILIEKKIGDSYCYFKLADVQFQPEELCFLETDELEFKVSSTSPALHLCGTVEKQWQHKRFHTLCVLTYDIQKKTSSVQRFYEESSSGEIYLKKIATLKRKLESILGPCFSWFVDTVEDEHEGYRHSDKLRLLLTSQNLCLLDHKMQVLHFHQLDRDNPDITISYDGSTKVLKMNFKQICPWSSFQTLKCITVQTGLGEEIKSKVDGMLTGSLSTTRRVLSWIMDTLDTPSDPEDLVCEEDISLPLPHLPNMPVTPPPPCHPVQRIAVENNDSTQSDCIFKQLALLPRTNLVRAESMNDLYLTPRRENINHVYMNMEYRKAHSKSGHEDGSYYSIYYCNTGWIQCHNPASPFRNVRHSRLSSEFGDVDFTAMKKHEQWFDQSFKRRSFDKVYSRLEENSTSRKEVWNSNVVCPLNIPLDDTSPSCVSSSRDDIYWNTNLCLCIHRAFESQLGKAALMEAFDVTWEQLLALFIHLDVNMLHVKAKDWKDFAGILELNLRDIEIIQHFCYTYREWPMFILLSYWMTLANRSCRVPLLPLCCHAELRNVLKTLGRLDLLKILTTRNTNEHVQVAQDDENTHL